MDEKVEVTNRWAAIMGFTETELQLVGPVEALKNVYTCGGSTAMGWASRS